MCDENSYYVISDCEGDSIYKNFGCECYNNEKCESCHENKKENIKNKKLKLIICGDILDSTSMIGSDDRDKKYNLRNLIEIYNNPQYIFLLGNRDINKIKCLLLNKINDDPQVIIQYMIVHSLSHDTYTQFKKDDIPSLKKYINSFNNGTIKFEEYQKFKELLNKYQIFWKENIQDWQIFWGPNPPAIQEDSEEGFDFSEQIKEAKEAKENDKKKSEDSRRTIEQLKKEYNVNNFFLNRFNDVFKISMGANNLLDKICVELGLGLGLGNTLTSDNKAFIVLTVFNSLLQKKTKNEYKYINKKYEDASNFEGLLYSVYMRDNTKICDSLIIENKYYIFSHGGITNTLIQDNTLIFNNYINFMAILSQNPNFNKRLIYNSTYLMAKSSCNNHKDFTIKCISKLNKRIANISNFLKKIISNIFDNEFERFQNIYFLLAMSASYDCSNEDLINNLEITKNNHYFKCPKGILFNSNISSPILPGFGELYKDPLKLTLNLQHKIYQVYGHKPAGFSASVKIFSNITYINLDITNSFRNTDLNNGNNRCYLIINDIETVIKTNIYFNQEKMILKEIGLTDVLKPGIMIKHDNNNKKTELFYSESFKSHVEKEFKLSYFNYDNLFDELKNHNIEHEYYMTLNKKENIFIHGIFRKSKNETSYILFTINYEGFDKNFFILSLDHFIFFMVNIFNYSDKQNKTAKLADNVSEVVEVVLKNDELDGGDIFLKKYLKTKAKYLNYKYI